MTKTGFIIKNQVRFTALLAAAVLAFASAGCAAQGAAPAQQQTAAENDSARNAQETAAQGAAPAQQQTAAGKDSARNAQETAASETPADGTDGTGNAQGSAVSAKAADEAVTAAPAQQQAADEAATAAPAQQQAAADAATAAPAQQAADEAATAEAAAESSTDSSADPSAESSEESSPEAAAAAVEIPENPVEREDGSVYLDVFAMDTYMRLTAYGEYKSDTERAKKAVLAGAKKIHSLDSMLSTGKADSEISLLNAAGRGTVSQTVMELIRRAKEVGARTGGLFDISIYPVMELWGFPSKEYRVPAREEIEKALKLVDYTKISVTPAADAKAADGAKKKTSAAEAAQTRDKKTQATAADVRLGISGMKIDLGGIAKGYTGDCMMKIFKDAGISSALVSLGGNVQALGSKPDGSAWRVAIQDPQNELEYLGILDIRNKAVVTSGGYERFFKENGITYHHIIDPRTGFPADSGILSATIISEDGTLADALSTSLFIMGKDEAEKFWREHSDTFDYILESTDGRLYVTEGVIGSFTTNAKTITIRKK